ncbi:hypothetical protein [Spirosoma endophyticum]|uniref:Uncharacterized protein n=1 Tax=Spirosoma endophyticum TaxID=662367 RepID=A0A1I1YCV3_9BACT|nr:hypothetical protein [Spirosoma endophyticum]SFE17437.1 hypothetical protein SAMN05216167_11119 [Spirosoma endophyticum]
MKSTNTQEAPNATIMLLRRLSVEKRETKRQMRESFTTDPEVQKALEKLDSQHAEKRRQAV